MQYIKILSLNYNSNDEYAFFKRKLNLKDKGHGHIIIKFGNVKHAYKILKPVLLKYNSYDHCNFKKLEMLKVLINVGQMSNVNNVWYYQKVFSQGNTCQT